MTDKRLLRTLNESKLAWRAPAELVHRYIRMETAMNARMKESSDALTKSGAERLSAGTAGAALRGETRVDVGIGEDHGRK
jgi:hypothetical protein